MCKFIAYPDVPLALPASGHAPPGHSYLSFTGALDPNLSKVTCPECVSIASAQIRNG